MKPSPRRQPRPPASPARKVDRTRLRLVEALCREVESTGRFSPEQVARRAGSSPATFYNHFASKEEALLAAFERVMDALVREVHDALEIEHLLDDGLERFALDYVLVCARFFRDNCLVLRAAQMEIPSSKSMRAVFRSHEQEALERYRRFVALGQKAGMIRAGDADTIARALLITSEGWNHPHVRALKKGSPLHRELADGLVRMLAPDRPSEEPTTRSTPSRRPAPRTPGARVDGSRKKGIR